MSAVFAIRNETDRLALGAERVGSLAFTVTNTSDRRHLAKVRIEPSGDWGASTLEVEGGAERSFDPNESEVFRVAVKVPKDAAAGEYLFRLACATVEDPDRTQTRGAPVAVAVAPPVLETPEPSPPSPTFRWWIPLAIAAGVVLLAGAGYAIYRLGSNAGNANAVAKAEEQQAIEASIASAKTAEASARKAVAVAGRSIASAESAISDAQARINRARSLPAPLMIPLRAQLDQAAAAVARAAQLVGQAKATEQQSESLLTDAQSLLAELQKAASRDAASALQADVEQAAKQAAAQAKTASEQAKQAQDLATAAGRRVPG